VEAPDGTRLNWAYIHGKDLVIVLPMDNDGNVILKREWRLNRKDFVWEVVSGWVDIASPTEDQLKEEANRELQEEVGYKAGTLTKLISIYPFNHMDSHFHLYLATDLEASTVELDEQQRVANDEIEILYVKKFPFAEAYDLVMNQQEPTGQNAVIFLLAKQRLGL
jgi:ADP-ribose pyrophosphatase